jgi:hypothetical protein
MRFGSSTTSASYFDEDKYEQRQQQANNNKHGNNNGNNNHNLSQQRHDLERGGGAVGVGFNQGGGRGTGQKNGKIVEMTSKSNRGDGGSNPSMPPPKSGLMSMMESVKGEGGVFDN